MKTEFNASSSSGLRSNPSRPTSVDTPLHGFIEYDFVDHTHPDAIIAVATSKKGKKITKSIFKDKVAWIDWQRPGFDLGLKLGKISKNKKYIGVVLGGHGLFTWGNSDKECYARSIKVIGQATSWLQKNSKTKPFGKLVGYKMVDGNSFGLVLELSNGSTSWFFENELCEVLNE